MRKTSPLRNVRVGRVFLSKSVIAARAALTFAGATLLLTTHLANAASNALDNAKAEELTRAVEPQVIAWRRDIHQHPELSNREFRTAKLVAEHLKKLGLEVQTGVAHTGVVAFLKGANPGPTIALRADMDALPVTEKTDVPFKSRETGTYRGQKVGVMHACGHDGHVAILMGIAQTLTKLRTSLHGNVLFIFQPAEEGAPEGEEGGAALMLKEGLFDKYHPDLAFGLHLWAPLNADVIGYRVGPFMAASDSFKITIKGRQSHGSRPWNSIDPIVTAAQIVNAMQTVVSRQIDITENPAVVTVGAINGGVRSNIIPENLEMIGTVRTFDLKQREQIMANLKRIVENTSAANGATGTFTLDPPNYPVTYNDPKLTEKALVSLKKVAGENQVKEIPLITGAEDFSFFGQKVPALYFFVGVTPVGQNAAEAPTNHSDFFFVDEAGVTLGLRAMTQLMLDTLQAVP
jgi:amidohydrolase